MGIANEYIRKFSLSWVIFGLPKNNLGEDGYDEESDKLIEYFFLSPGMKEAKYRPCL